MQLHKDQVTEMLRNRGDVEQARRAETELPDMVDTKEHLVLLESLGIDARLLDGSSDEARGG
jgi:hypothetical protein